MDKPATIIVYLMPEQEKLMTPFLDYLTHLTLSGKPGILSAQIFGDHMRVGIISYEKGIEAIKEAGGNPDARVKSAF